MKGKIVSLALASLLLTGATAPIAALNGQNNVKNVIASAINENEQTNASFSVDLDLIRNVVGKILSIDQEDLKTLNKYRALVETTNDGLPMYEDQSYTPNFEDIKYSGVYMVQLVKYLLNDVFVNEKCPDIFSSVIEQVRQLLDFIMPLTDDLKAFIDSAKIQEPSQEDILDFYECGKTIYNSTKEMINKTTDPEEEQGGEAYKKHFNDFKTYVINNLNANLSYNEATLIKYIFEFIKKIFANSVSNLDSGQRSYFEQFFDNAYKAYLNRENLTLVNDANILGYTWETIDDIDDDTGRKGAFRSFIEYITKFMVIKYDTELTAESAKAILSNWGPGLYKFLDLFESYGYDDLDNMKIMGLESLEDTNLFFTNVFEGGHEAHNPLIYAKCVSINRIYSCMNATSKPDLVEAGHSLVEYIKTLKSSSNGTTLENADDLKEKVDYVRALTNIAITSLNNLVNPNIDMQGYNGVEVTNDLIELTKELKQETPHINIPSWYKNSDFSTLTLSNIDLNKEIPATQMVKYEEKISTLYTIEELPNVKKYAINIHSENELPTPTSIPIKIDDSVVSYYSKYIVLAVNQSDEVIQLEKETPGNNASNNHYIVNGNIILMNPDKNIKSILVVFLDSFKVIDNLLVNIAEKIIEVTAMTGKTREERIALAAPIKANIVAAREEIQTITQEHPELKELPRTKEASEILTLNEAEVENYISTETQQTNNVGLYLAIFLPIIGILILLIVFLLLKRKKNKKEEETDK